MANVDYRTVEMDHAERELDARIEYAYGKAREVQAKTERLAAKTAAKGDAPPSDADVERIEKFVRGHAKTPEWEKVIERIDRGHLTWRQVVESLAGGPIDPEVNAAFRSLSKVPPASMDELIAIGVLPARPPEDDAAQSEPARAPRPTRPRVDQTDDDDWFANITAVDRKKR